MSQLRRPVLVHLAEVVRERDVGDLEVLTLDHYLVSLADGSCVGTVLIHRLGREDDVRLISLESDIGVLVEVYGLKLQLGLCERLELGKAHAVAKGRAKLVDREIHGQYEGVPAVLGEGFGKMEDTVLVGDALLQVVQVATELVEHELLAPHVAGVEHAEVIEHRPFVGVRCLAGVANVDTEGDAGAVGTSLANHLLRHLYDHAIDIIARLVEFLARIVHVLFFDVEASLLVVSHVADLAKRSRAF